MLEKLYCFECGDELKDYNNVFEIGGGELICEDCRENYYTYCEDCDYLVYDDTLVMVDDDRYVCRSCADYYYTCNHCDNLYSSSNLAVDTFYITLCQTCYEDHYFTCAGCDEVYSDDECEYINGDYYCQDCAHDHGECIHSYSYKPRPLFFGGKAGYGLEIEIDDGDSRQDAAQDITDAGDGHVYLKDDGSLSSQGIEIVTHPASLDYHVNRFPWDDICSTALDYGYRSHDTDTCGLHIHASRSLFGGTQIEQDLTIAKIMLLVDRWYYTKIVKFARRDIGKMRRWADKPNADIRPGDDDTNAIYKSKKYAGNRYRAINLCNSHTVEFRFFRGTLKRDTIIASIQWVDTIINYCRQTPLKDLFDTSWDDIFGNTEHVELKDYLEKRNLLKMGGM